MAQDKEFVEWIVELLQPLDVRSKAMFGAFMLYCDEKPVAIIGDDQLYIKQSEADPALFADTELAPPYDGAKDYHLVPAELLEAAADWLQEAIQATADALPLPKRKKRSSGRKRDSGAKDDPALLDEPQA